jgi:hypothetical protein
MPNTPAEPIQVGALTVRFHVDADESGGSVSVFQCDVPANARMPAPRSHDDFDGGHRNDRRSHAPSWPDSRTTGLTG